MQASPRPEMTDFEIHALDTRLGGMVKNAVPYDAELMAEAVNDPDVQDVKVFKLRHGVKIKIGEEIFRAQRIGKNVTLQKLA
jgi:hypothetical protein